MVLLITFSDCRGREYEHRFCLHNLQNLNPKLSACKEQGQIPRYHYLYTVSRL